MSNRSDSHRPAAGLGSPTESDPPASNNAHPVERRPFTIGDCRVEPDRLQVVRGDEARKLEPMAMRLLVFLAQRPGEVVSRSAILDEVWEGRAVVDETLSRAMSLVRQALGDSAQNPRYIETVPRRGYRLLIAVERTSSTTTAKPRHAAAGGSSSDRDAASVAALWRWRAVVAVAILAGVLVAGLLVVQGRRGADSADPATSSPAPNTRMGIAVLPFEDLSPAPGNGYIADGLTEELIHQLAGIAGLRVVSRTSSMTFRDSNATAPEIAEALGVEFLLQGTVLTIDDQLRITVQLIRPVLDEHLMSRSYDRDFSEILDLQRAVAKDVAEQTRTKLSPMEVDRLTQGRSVDAAAYRAFLQGQQSVQQRSDLARGLDLLQHAVEIEPTFAAAWAALANAYLLSNSYLGHPAESTYTGAASAINQALRFDPESATAHAALGLLRVQRDRDWARSEASYRRAIALEPSNVTAHQWLSELLSLLNRHQEALSEIEIAIDLDPLSPLVHAAAAQRLNAAGRLTEMLRRSRDAEALGARFRWLEREKAWALERLGRHQEGLALLVALGKTRRPTTAAEQNALDLAVQTHGKVGYFRWEHQQLLKTDPRLPGYPTWMATVNAGMGLVDDTLHWLAKAVPERNMWLVHSLRDTAFDGLRDDPRLIGVLEDIPLWHPEPVPSGSAPSRSVP
ncbi:MAG: winged helix-turn-helix domain-containing protein [Acidobacteriota bacterium]